MASCRPELQVGFCALLTGQAKRPARAVNEETGTGDAPSSARTGQPDYAPAANHAKPNPAPRLTRHGACRNREAQRQPARDLSEFARTF
jgi:hypothetical protein